MTETGVESKDDNQDSILDVEQKISRSEFLKRLAAGGVVSAVALSGLGSLQSAFGDKESHSKSENEHGVPAIIQQLTKIRKQLDELQSQFGNLISGKLNVPELAVQKLMASNGTVIKLDIHDTGYLKIDGLSTFHKLEVPDTGYLKIDGQSTFLKLDIPESGFIKIDGQSMFLKLDIPKNGFIKVEGDAAFIKLNAAEITAQKIVAESITTPIID